MKQNTIFSPSVLSVYAVTVVFYTIVYGVLMILPIYIHDQTASYITIGWIMGITMLTSMMCRPLAGRLVDRYGASCLLLTAICLFAVSLGGYFVDSTFVYWLVRLMQGALAACFSTAMEITMIHLLSDRLRTQGLSLYSLATVIPTAFAPSISLYLMQHISVKSLFICLFILGMCNIHLGWYLFKKIKKIDVKSTTVVPSTLKSFFYNTQLLFPTVIMTLTSVGNGAIFTFLPLYLSKQSSAFAAHYFLLQMVTLMCVRFIGAKFLKLHTSFPTAFIFLLLLLIFFGLSLISFSHSHLTLSIAAIANGIAYALLYPALLTLISFRIASIYKGYFLGIFIGGADFGFAMGSILVGMIAQIFSLQLAFFFCALLVLVALPFCFMGKSLVSCQRAVSSHP